ncbi:FliO/MopB family protein [Mucisphaera sp.]|uniref:FliO/MopB family protein n=1 Tax=Mucisphaera sp. TaxID=2913024 RepID=UPI003D11FB4B
MRHHRARKTQTLSPGARPLQGRACLYAFAFLACFLINTASADRLTALALDMTEPEPRHTTNAQSPQVTIDDERTLLPPTASLRDDLQPLGAPQNNAETQTLPASSDQTSYWWLLETAAALGVVIALIFAARWLYQKLSGHQAVTARPTADVEVLSRTTVAPRSQILLLRVGQRVLVCSDTGQALSCLSEITQPEEVAAILGRTSTTAASGFSDVLRQLENEPEDLTATTEPVDRAREDLSQLLSRIRNTAANTNSQLASSTKANRTKPKVAAVAGGAGGWVG